jgi:methyl-accepting chemotaxis protein
MTIRKTTRLSLLLLFVVLLVTNVLGFFGYRSLSADIQALNTEFLPKQKMVPDLRSSFSDLRGLLSTHVLEITAAEKRELEKQQKDKRDEITQKLKKMREAFQASAMVISEIDKLEGLYGDYNAVYNDVVNLSNLYTGAETLNYQIQASNLLIDKSRPIMREMIALTNTIYAQSVTATNDLVAKSQKHAGWAQIKSIIGLVIGVLIVGAVFIVIEKKVLAPLNSGIRDIEKIASGETEIVISGQERIDEMGALAKAAEALRQNVDTAYRLKQMVQEMPTNIMTLDVRNDFKINYINNTSINTLRGLEAHLPVKADNMIGQTMDIFHKNPAHQRRMLATPDHLPHRAKIKVGPESLQLLVSAIRNGKGEYVGAMLTWDVITAKENMAKNVSNVVQGTTAAVTELEATALSLSKMAEETQAQSTTVAAAAEQASANVSTVASSTEELTSSIGEISQRIQESARKADEAARQADMTNQTVQSLKTSADRIGAVISLINDIAEQTNLLALNATIEAARAGDAGKGFAVVASEVKTLANETGKATEEIRQQITEMQMIAQQSADSISEISSSIATLNSLSSSVAAAIEEQLAATQEIARSVEQASQGTREVTQSIARVSESAGETDNAARQVLETAKDLGRQSDTLSREIDTFVNGKAA